MVDARDLKSLGAKALCRFESGRPHQRIVLWSVFLEEFFAVKRRTISQGSSMLLSVAGEDVRAL
jgi:hypothetical protein